ncbi:MAG: NAD(P)-dependent oxidoreductase [Alphaproteobacteria bacterium]|nr:NAD(P)-dependent oxidoreductase [Alphaproteobacteria bacterium]
MKIGCVGLGQMGRAIAGNLVRAGHEVRVWNRTAPRAEPLGAAGATVVASPSEAADADVVLTMLADDAAVEGVVFGERGILGCRAMHVSMSTIGIAFADRLDAAHAERGQAFLSAPVFGRPAAAEAAQLFVLCAGAEEARRRAGPLFTAISQRVFELGEKPSAANLVKLCGNFMIMAATEAMAEAMTLAEKGGIARAALLEVLTGTLFGAPLYKTYGQLLVDDRFRPAGFAAPLGLKDMKLAAAAADAARVPMPLLSLVRDRLVSAIATEGEEIDWAGIALPVRRAAGL